MKSSEEILNELITISPLVASIEKINVFQVPKGYFDGLHFRITDYAILNNASPAENVNKRNFQEVPSGYFESLSSSILAKVKEVYPAKHESTSETLPLLSGLKSINVLSVPNGYFDHLSESIFSKLKIISSENAHEELRNLSTVLYSLKDVNVFKVPTGYFDGIGDSVFNNLKIAGTESFDDELRNLSMTLYSLKDINVFEAPKGYFKSLENNIAEKLKPAPARVIAMKKRSSWLRYAAAAVIAGIITISSLEIFHKPDSELASLPDYVRASFKYKTSEDLDMGLAKLSDADISKYLEKNGNVMDNELLTNNANVSEMPDATDYLSDENTLNNYLDKIDAENVGKLTP
jgi:hypothetical protein